MANEKLRRPENLPGEFFVDSTCIDCDTCRWVAGASFKQAGNMSAVLRQPETPEERRDAIHALLSCPTASIGCTGDKKEIFDRAKDFPLPIAGGVYYCGFASKDSYGAASYFIKREGGNVLIDSPRINAGLAKAIQGMG